MRSRVRVQVRWEPTGENTLLRIATRLDRPQPHRPPTHPICALTAGFQQLHHGGVPLVRRPAHGAHAHMVGAGRISTSAEERVHARQGARLGSFNERWLRPLGRLHRPAAAQQCCNHAGLVISARAAERRAGGEVRGMQGATRTGGGYASARPHRWVNGLGKRHHHMLVAAVHGGMHRRERAVIGGVCARSQQHGNQVGAPRCRCDREWGLVKIHVTRRRARRAATGRQQDGNDLGAAHPTAARSGDRGAVAFALQSGVCPSRQQRDHHVGVAPLGGRHERRAACLAQRAVSVKAGTLGQDGHRCSPARDGGPMQRRALPRVPACRHVASRLHDGTQHGLVPAAHSDDDGMRPRGSVHVAHVMPGRAPWLALRRSRRSGLLGRAQAGRNLTRG
jgi:hypothetical protein